MRADSDPAEMTADERRHAVATILARGLCRLRDRAALETRTALPSEIPAEIPSEPAANPLETVGENPLSDHVG